MNVKMLTKNEIIRFEKVDYPFQKFEIVNSANNIFLNARYKSFVRYYGVENNGEVVLIVPIRKVVHNDSCYIVGTKEYFDIVDCLYCSKDVLELADAYKTFFDALKKEGISAVYWDWLPDDTLTKDALLRLNQTNAIKFVFEPIYNVKIDLGGCLNTRRIFKNCQKALGKIYARHIIG